MIVSQLQFSAGQWIAHRPRSVAANRDAQLVLVFGDRKMLATGDYFGSLREKFADAHIVSCSSGGDILGDTALEDGITATAVRFERGSVHAIEEPVADAGDSERAGAALAARLGRDELRHVLVFAEGLQVNGSSLARGLSAGLPPTVSVSGGLAGDGDRFECTLVGLDRPPASGRVVAVGIYGDAISVGIGSFGGWDAIGEVRTVTRSDGNVLYELDGRRALDLYKELLGPFGYALPASGLSFPLKIWKADSDRELVRTILGINEADGSITFAGDVPQGWTAQLLRSDLDTLIRAAGVAAGQIPQPVENGGTRLAIAISCIGRKLLLQKRVGEELVSVLKKLGSETEITGFYSYGELAPAAGFSVCDLHNQTMTLTVLGEVV